MKKLSVVLTTAIVLCACVYAQSEDRQILRVTVPFSFTAENTSFPAGVYSLYLVKPFNVVRVQSVDGRNVAFVRSTEAESSSYSERGALVFRRIAGQYFLTGAREAHSDLKREIPLGGYAQELARNRDRQQAPTSVTVAGR